MTLPPTRDELLRVLSALQRMADAQGATAPVVCDRDLEHLAAPRPGVTAESMLRLLDAAGLIRESSWDGRVDDRDRVHVWPVARPTDLTAAWDATRTVARALRARPTFGAGGAVAVHAAELGLERAEVLRAVRLLCAFGCLTAAPVPADGRLPRVAAGPVALDVLAGPSALCAGGIVDAVLSEVGASGRPVDLRAVSADVAASTDAVLDALVAAHLLGAVVVDAQSWRRAPGSTVRVVRLTPGRDPVEAAGAAARPDVAVDAGDATDGLNDGQRAAVTSPAGRLVVVAGAGTGKTRTLTRRIAHRVRTGAVRADGVIAVTFTTDATSEMQVRLAELGVRGARVSTLNALGYRMVRDAFRAVGFTAPPQVVPAGQQLALVRDLLNADLEGAGLDALQVHTAITRAKAERWSPAALAAASDPGFRCPEPRVTGRVWRRYQEALRAANAVDYADQLWLAAELLGDDARADAARDGVDELYVDEFQDLSPVQVSLVMRLAEGRGLTVVGDPRQAIYEWNGATPEALDRLARRRDGHTQQLDVNYRSTDPILRAANRLMTGSGLRPVRTPAPTPGPAPGAHHARDETAAVDVIRLLLDEHRRAGVPDDVIAVLVRINDELRTVQRGLTAAGLQVHAADLVGLHQTAVFRAAQRSLTPDLVDAAGGLAAAMDALLVRDDPPTALAGAGEDPQEVRADWARLTEALREHDRAGVDDPGRAFAAIARQERGEERRTPGAGILLTTMHRAKGREWDCVIVACLDPRTLDGRQAEERRVAYVALTRARRRLDVVSVGGDRRLLTDAGLTIPGGGQETLLAQEARPRRRPRSRRPAGR